MKKDARYIMLFLCGIISVTLSIGCTPGRSQIKNTVQKKSFDAKTNEINDDENDKVNDRNEIKVKNGKHNGEDRQFENEESLSFDSKNDASDDNSYKKEKFYQSGVASWYGREFQGKKTASGEVFNMNGLTAAHKTLPFGTVVEVKNMDNGKTVKVKINDRGPYRGKRILDLSYNAAKNLDMVKSGEAYVGIRILKKGSDESLNEENPDSGKNIEPVSDSIDRDSNEAPGEEVIAEGKRRVSLQAGAFYSEKNANNLKTKIEGLTKNPVAVIHDGDFYKVKVSGIPSRGEAEKFKKRLTKENISSYIIDNN